MPVQGWVIELMRQAEELGVGHAAGPRGYPTSCPSFSESRGAAVFEEPGLELRCLIAAMEELSAARPRAVAAAKRYSMGDTSPEGIEALSWLAERVDALIEANDGVGDAD